MCRQQIPGVFIPAVVDSLRSSVCTRVTKYKQSPFKLLVEAMMDIMNDTKRRRIIIKRLYKSYNGAMWAARVNRLMYGEQRRLLFRWDEIQTTKPCNQCQMLKCVNSEERCLRKHIHATQRDEGRLQGPAHKHKHTVAQPRSL